MTKIAVDLNEGGLRAYLHFLADNLKQSTLEFILCPWLEDVDLQGPYAGVELRRTFSKTGNPVTFEFEPEHIEYEEVEDERNAHD